MASAAGTSGTTKPLPAPPVEPNDPIAKGPADGEAIDALVDEAEQLFRRGKASEKEALERRVELGRVLIELKAAVGHGNFMGRFQEWVASGKINFSLRTGERAMAYAELEAAGKFDGVSNLADAERLRKAEAKRSREEQLEGADSGAVGGAPVADEGTEPVSLTDAQVARKAKGDIAEIIEFSREADDATRVSYLEEIIELLTEELERCR